MKNRIRPQAEQLEAREMLDATSALANSFITLPDGSRLFHLGTGATSPAPAAPRTVTVGTVLTLRSPVVTVPGNGRRTAPPTLAQQLEPLWAVLRQQDPTRAELQAERARQEGALRAANAGRDERVGRLARKHNVNVATAQAWVATAYGRDLERAAGEAEGEAARLRREALAQRDQAQLASNAGDPVRATYAAIQGNEAELAQLEREIAALKLRIEKAVEESKVADLMLGEPEPLPTALPTFVVPRNVYAPQHTLNAGWDVLKRQDPELARLNAELQSKQKLLDQLSAQLRGLNDRLAAMYSPLDFPWLQKLTSSARTVELNRRAATADGKAAAAQTAINHYTSRAEIFRREPVASTNESILGNNARIEQAALRQEAILNRVEAMREQINRTSRLVQGLTELNSKTFAAAGSVNSGLMRQLDLAQTAALVFGFFSLNDDFVDEKSAGSATAAAAGNAAGSLALLATDTMSFIAMRTQLEAEARSVSRTLPAGHQVYGWWVIEAQQPPAGQKLGLVQRVSFIPDGPPEPTGVTVIRAVSPPSVPGAAPGAVIYTVRDAFSKP